jgi:AcrR family transcriptional regulator
MTAPRRYSPAQTRTIEAALDLFAERGVTATSLQMIADAVGVTKAAIYHQFRSKGSIVIAVAELELQRLEAWVDEAEAAGADDAARDVLLGHLVDIALERRGAVATLQVDPGLVAFLGSHAPFQELMVRMFAVLVGHEAGTGAQVEAAMLSALIGGTLGHPFVDGLDDATLKDELLRLARRLLELPA